MSITSLVEEGAKWAGRQRLLFKKEWRKAGEGRKGEERPRRREGVGTAVEVGVAEPRSRSEAEVALRD